MYPISCLQRLRSLCQLRTISKDVLIKYYSSKPPPRTFYGIRDHRAERSTAMYAGALAIFALGVSFAAVPLYKVYCQATGKGGKAYMTQLSEKIQKMLPEEERQITIYMEADTGSQMDWNFKPLQQEITVVPGETALVFYSAFNPHPRQVTGVATYTVLPYEAGVYLNKIQCFCFEEQMLNPQEEVELPIFFYIDPEYAKDPLLENIDNIVLHYTFFESRDTLHLPFIDKLTGGSKKDVISS